MIPFAPPLPVKDLSALVMPHVSPTLWERLPECKNYQYECDIDGVRHVLRPILLAVTLVLGDIRKPEAGVKELTAEMLAPFGAKLNECLERRLVRARLSGPSGLPLAIVEDCLVRTMVFVLLYSEFTLAELNEKLGGACFTGEDEIPNSWIET